MSETAVRNYIESLPDNQPGIAIELGANHGLYTDLIAKKFEKCFAFECDPTNIEILTRNVKQQNVTIVPKAVGIVDGKSRLYKCPPNMGGHTLVEEHAKIGVWGHSLDNYIWVPTITLDKFVEQHKATSIKFIKCDIEGAENFVFDYAKALFLTMKLTMLIEIHKTVDIVRLYDLFTEQYGYKVYYLDDQPDGHKTGDEADLFGYDIHYRITNE